jgi:hypothetical protein
LLARLHSSIATTGCSQLSLFATGPCSIGTLDRVSRRNLSCDLFLSDAVAGPNRLFQVDPDSRDFTLKLRLERFRTSHARVHWTLLLPHDGASKMKAKIVIFLFKTGPGCGQARKEVAHEIHALKTVRSNFVIS